MSEAHTETIHFPDLDVAIVRQSTQEVYLALQPPDANAYVVAAFETPVEEIALFVQQRLDALRELRTDMIKHFKKTKSMKCRFRTGDIAHLLGRPFMLRAYPLATSHGKVKGHRGRANVHAVMYPDISVIDLYVVQSGNYDQGRAAFFSYAKPVFAHNVESLLQQSMQRVFPDATLPASVNCRPMRDSWVRFDDEHDTVWFSESLIPYPAYVVVYAFLSEAVKRYAADASDEQRELLIARGVPGWQEMRDILADPNNRYAL